MGAKLRLFNDSRKNSHHRERFQKRPKPVWVDVSDDEGKRKRKHLKINGVSSPKLNGKHIGSPSQSQKPPRKVVNDQVHMEEDVDIGFHGGTSSSDIPAATSSKHAAILEQRANLPIAKGKEALINEFRSNDVCVLLGETGSGKTTQVPQYLLESGLAGNGMIAVTQPRRVAATSLAARVAAEQNVKVGSLVGYSVRFDERSGPDTRIKYLTDGMIVRELLSDPLLSKYSILIVDEAHERSLRTDLLIANLKTIQAQRNGSSDVKGKGKERENPANPLKIIVMSATLDAEKFAKFFSGSKVIYVQGRQHPVTIYHSSQSQVDYVDAAMRTFFQIHTDQPPGDVLIFLPGQEDIESLEKSIRLYANQLPQNQQDVLVCSMYASQAPGQNAKVFNSTPPNTRKCILATNIAETSITIPGVKYVIDTGKCKEKRYLAKNTGGGFDTLLTRDITKSSAMQRAGRAGREGVGYCFRLYTEDSFNSMALSAEPEILRCGLASPMLQLKCLGQDLETLDLMDKPDTDSMISALKTLFLIGALDQTGQITQLGREMAAFPLEPVYSRAVLASKEYGCTSEVLTIISVLSTSSKLFIDSSEQRDTVSEVRRKFRHASGDHLTILNVVRAYRDVALSENKSGRREWCRKHFLNERALIEANDIREQLQQTCGRLGIDSKVSCSDKDEPIIQALGHGLVANTAFLQPDGSYKQTMGQSVVKIHPSSSLCDKKAPTIIYDEVVYTNQIYARGVSIINKSFLASLGALKLRQA
ncbi:atp-dependent rna helicase prh1 [Moniliophthora roreri MCA 2997]|uniref:RNA helicase n=2 Tax=Moniliophthora roreri TaxID=221103 RepID=V2X9S4_MONRO|nr:atp-dependent rna helicase prh1 [Moniliophthora roreri MCA 2997]